MTVVTAEDLGRPFRFLNWKVALILKECTGVSRQGTGVGVVEAVFVRERLRILSLRGDLGASASGGGSGGMGCAMPEFWGSRRDWFTVVVKGDCSRVCGVLGGGSGGIGLVRTSSGNRQARNGSEWLVAMPWICRPL